jgi:hypothetical protein
VFRWLCFLTADPSNAYLITTQSSPLGYSFPPAPFPSPPQSVLFHCCLPLCFAHALRIARRRGGCGWAGRGPDLNTSRGEGDSLRSLAVSRGVLFLFRILCSVSLTPVPHFLNTRSVHPRISASSSDWAGLCGGGSRPGFRPGFSRDARRFMRSVLGFTAASTSVVI